MWKVTLLPSRTGPPFDWNAKLMTEDGILIYVSIDANKADEFRAKQIVQIIYAGSIADRVGKKNERSET